MSDFFKKALGMFVEIEVPESEAQPNAGTKPPLSASTSSRSQTSVVAQFEF